MTWQVGTFKVDSNSHGSLVHRRGLALGYLPVPRSWEKTDTLYIHILHSLFQLLKIGVCILNQGSDSEWFASHFPCSLLNLFLSWLLKTCSERKRPNLKGAFLSQIGLTLMALLCLPCRADSFLQCDLNMGWSRSKDAQFQAKRLH